VQFEDPKTSGCLDRVFNVDLIKVANYPGC